MSVPKVLQWLNTLAPPQNTGLSNAGSDEALDAALSPIKAFLQSQDFAGLKARYDHATMVAASTVFTAPLEWVTLLLASGTQVRLKRPERSLAIWDSWAQTVGDLPFSVTTDRTEVLKTDLLIAMGSDNTIHRLKERCTDATTFLGFGNKFSIAFVTNAAVSSDHQIPRAFNDIWGRVAADTALHDTRGCMSPSIVFTTTPLHEALQYLSVAMERAESVWPRGEITEFEGAKIRERTILGKLVGHVKEGKHYTVIGLPTRYASIQALPRVLQVVQVDSVADVLSFVGRHETQLSTIGTDLEDTTELQSLVPNTRVCSLGRMQRPPIQRLHDGVPWLDTLFHRP